MAFEKSASIQSQNLNEPDDAANTLTEAFKVYRKSDPEDAARVLDSAIQHYVLKGNLRRAATQQQHLAEVYEVELGDMKKALAAYEKAAEWFEGDNAEAYDPSSISYWPILVLIVIGIKQNCQQALSQGG